MNALRYLIHTIRLQWLLLCEETARDVLKYVRRRSPN